MPIDVLAVQLSVFHFLGLLAVGIGVVLFVVLVAVALSVWMDHGRD